MEPERLGFWARLWLALILPWKILFNGVVAAQVQKALPKTPQARDKALALAAAEPTTALQLLSILQREGRFIDFLQEEVGAFSDAQVGAAARVVHEGCKRAVNEYLVLEPVRAEQEGESVVLEPGFNADETRVTGNVVGEPPFSGRLAHHGWRVRGVRLPTLTDGHDPTIVAPAEVEI